MPHSFAAVFMCLQVELDQETELAENWLIYVSAKANIREVMEVCVGGTQGILSWCCVPWCSFRVSL